MTLEEVTAEMTALGEKSFRAKQLYDWLHVKLAESFDDMKDTVQGPASETEGKLQSYRFTGSRRAHFSY